LASTKSIVLTVAEACLPDSYVYRLDVRLERIPWALFRGSEVSCVHVLDVGPSLDYVFVLASKVRQNKQLMIATLASEQRCIWILGVLFLFGDLRNLLIRDSSQDLVCCISTIEHAGMDNEQYAADQLEACAGRPDEF
jgi:hypothetical protein